MFENKIPPLKFSDVAQYDRESICAVTGLLVLTFPANESDLPDNSRLMVSVRRPVHDGDAVAAATRSGKSVTGFYHVSGEYAEIISVTRKIRLHWHIGEEKNLLNWIFPVLSVDIPCCDNTKSPRHTMRPGAEKGNLLDRSFQVGNQVDGFVEVVE